MLGQCTQTGNMRGICALHAQKDPLDAVLTSQDRNTLPLKYPPEIERPASARNIRVDRKEDCLALEGDFVSGGRKCQVQMPQQAICATESPSARKNIRQAQIRG